MEPIIGQIIMFAGNFAPRGWKFCNGELLSISQHSTLFSILNNTYGGDGRTSFALPDLRGRVPISAGSGPDLSTYQLGQSGGVESVALKISQIPQHNHSATFTSKKSEPITANAIIKAKNGKGDKDSADGNYLATGAIGNGRDSLSVNNGYSTTADSTMNSQAVDIKITGGGSNGYVKVGYTGHSQPVPVMQPYLAMHYIIALEGVYPSRN